MPFRYLIAGQWQGSGSARAMRLVDGAEAIRGDLPSARTEVLEVPLGAGDAQETGVHRASSVLTVRDRIVEFVDRSTDPVIVIGGDCGVEFGAVDAVAGDDLAVVWFDAHPDLHTADSSASGAFTGMVLRALLGDLPAPFAPRTATAADRVVLVGTRSVDDAEESALAETALTVIPASAEGDAEALAEQVVAAVLATGARRIYLHIDLDVLDPEHLQGLADPVPFGLSPEALTTTLRTLTARFPVAGAGITCFAPATPEAVTEDASTILRILAALGRG